jgi:hypothetical protein
MSQFNANPMPSLEYLRECFALDMSFGAFAGGAK